MCGGWWVIRLLVLCLGVLVIDLGGWVMRLGCLVEGAVRPSVGGFVCFVV